MRFEGTWRTLLRFEFLTASCRYAVRGAGTVFSVMKFSAVHYYDIARHVIFILFRIVAQAGILGR